jgi:antitoxin CptB
MDETLPAAFNDPADQARRRRLLFRAQHRGTRENDLLIGEFVAAGLARFGDSELSALEAIMELPDPLIGDYLTGRGPMPAGHDSAMLLAMREAALNRKTAGKGLLF